METDICRQGKAMQPQCPETGHTPSALHDACPEWHQERLIELALTKDPARSDIQVKDNTLLLPCIRLSKSSVRPVCNAFSLKGGLLMTIRASQAMLLKEIGVT